MTAPSMGRGSGLGQAAPARGSGCQDGTTWSLPARSLPYRLSWTPRTSAPRTCGGRPIAPGTSPGRSICPGPMSACTPALIADLLADARLEAQPVSPGDNHHQRAPDWLAPAIAKAATELLDAGTATLHTWRGTIHIQLERPGAKPAALCVPSARALTEGEGLAGCWSASAIPTGCATSCRALSPAL
jgi:hypothetical protein